LCAQCQTLLSWRRRLYAYLTIYKNSDLLAVYA
jgi:hypothetical protein